MPELVLLTRASPPILGASPSKAPAMALAHADPLPPLPPALLPSTPPSTLLDPLWNEDEDEVVDVEEEVVEEVVEVVPQQRTKYPP